MWMLLGGLAILATGLNLVWWLRQKNGSLFAGLALSFTAFTLCDFYSDIAKRATCGDWGGILDIAPSMSSALWVLTGISVLFNLLALWSYQRKK